MHIEIRPITPNTRVDGPPPELPPDEPTCLIGGDANDSSFDQAAWDEWYREQIRLSIEDPRPNIPHEQAMKEIRDLIEEGERSSAHARRNWPNPPQAL